MSSELRTKVKIVKYYKRGVEIFRSYSESLEEKTFRDTVQYLKERMKQGNISGPIVIMDAVITEVIEKG